MKLLTFVVAILLSANQQAPKPGAVASVTDPKANFSVLKTYTWEKGQEAFDPTAHKAIVAAIDAEMTARGLVRLSSGVGDVKIRYHTVTRTDVVLDKLDEVERQKSAAPTKNMGRLVIVMRDGSNRRIWAADTVQPLDPNLANVYKEIPSVVSKLFETYPGRKLREDLNDTFQ
jgi:hypothetical protein